MVFTLNIGNTNCQTGIYKDNKIEDFQTFPTTELTIDKLPEKMPLAAACVVPEIKDKLENTDIFWLTPFCQTDLQLSLVDPSTLGADRLANAIALAKTSELPAVCIDCGTAITMDVVDENKFYYGGVIAPGRLLLRKSLNEHTGQLPLVPLFDKIKNTIGKNTVEAISAGTDIGIICMLQGLVAKVKLELDIPSLHIVLTGGDRIFFLKYFENATDGGADFTLKGIGTAWEMNQ